MAITVQQLGTFSNYWDIIPDPLDGTKVWCLSQTDGVTLDQIDLTTRTVVTTKVLPATPRAVSGMTVKVIWFDNSGHIYYTSAGVRCTKIHKVLLSTMVEVTTLGFDDGSTTHNGDPAQIGIGWIDFAYIPSLPNGAEGLAVAAQATTILGRCSLYIIDLTNMTVYGNWSYIDTTNPNTVNYNNLPLLPAQDLTGQGGIVHPPDASVQACFVDKNGLVHFILQLTTTLLTGGTLYNHTGDMVDLTWNPSDGTTSQPAGTTSGAPFLVVNYTEVPWSVFANTMWTDNFMSNPYLAITGGTYNVPRGSSIITGTILRYSPDNGVTNYMQVCTKAGITDGASVTSFSTVDGTATADGTANWTCYQFASYGNLFVQYLGGSTHSMLTYNKGALPYGSVQVSSTVRSTGDTAVIALSGHTQNAFTPNVITASSAALLAAFGGTTISDPYWALFNQNKILTPAQNTATAFLGRDAGGSFFYNGTTNFSPDGGYGSIVTPATLVPVAEGVAGTTWNYDDAVATAGFTVPTWATTGAYVIGNSSGGKGRPQAQIRWFEATKQFALTYSTTSGGSAAYLLTLPATAAGFSFGGLFGF